MFVKKARMICSVYKPIVISLTFWKNCQIQIIHLFTISIQGKMRLIINFIIFVKDIFCNKVPKISEYQIQVRITPEIISNKIITEHLSVSRFIIT